ncbi:MAG: serine/threonine protein kinase [Planctomycetes bacterium]|nr:serine/threonine protein kinase [Planctomycetota bacterium]
MNPQATTLGYSATEGPPPNLPDLDLLRCIGSGSFGRVWLARNRATGKLLAVKIIRRFSAGMPAQAAREVQAIARLEANLAAPHENLLTIHHVGQTDEWLYYTMDLADDARQGKGDNLLFRGGKVECPLFPPDYRPATLGTRLDAGPLAPDECFGLARQLLAGLAHLHGAGLAHRDVKPANCVFVGGRLKLADFGLVTQAEGTSSLIGTPRYMPPDGVMDARADVYAAGLVIYEMLTGLPADRFPRLPPHALNALRHPACAALNRIALRAANRDRAARFRDAREMLHALDTLSMPAMPMPRLRLKKGLIIASACAAAALAALVALLVRQPATPHVNVNFITLPYEAEIYLDGKRLLDPRGQPYATPCTVPGLPARPHRVVFRRPGLPDLVVEKADFSATREVEANWAGEMTKGK